MSFFYHHVIWLHIFAGHGNHFMEPVRASFLYFRTICFQKSYDNIHNRCISQLRPRYLCSSKHFMTLFRFFVQFFFCSYFSNCCEKEVMSSLFMLSLLNHIKVRLNIFSQHFFLSHMFYSVFYLFLKLMPKRSYEQPLILLVNSNIAK